MTSLPPAFILFLSTPSARRATCGGGVPLLAVRDFYPRPPRGGRLLFCRTDSFFDAFLSTPSARRATSPTTGTGTHPADFYPRPPRGGRQRRAAHVKAGVGISIHALREEGDSCSLQIWLVQGNFYPRPPRGGRLTGICPSSFFLIFLSTPSARRATAD